MSGRRSDLRQCRRPRRRRAGPDRQRSTKLAVDPSQEGVGDHQPSFARADDDGAAGIDRSAEDNRRHPVAVQRLRVTVESPTLPASSDLLRLFGLSRARASRRASRTMRARVAGVPDQGGVCAASIRTAWCGFRSTRRACRQASSRRGRRSDCSRRERRRRSSMATTGSVRSSAPRAMSAALDLARTHGTGFVGVRHSNHFGPAAYYVEKAIARGCIGLAISNAPPNMAPFGGRTRFLGTNPVAIGIPAGAEAAADLRRVDQRGRARQDHRRGAHRCDRFPKAGPSIRMAIRPPIARQALAGAVLPFGGPKGSAISFIIDIFCGVLTGAAFASHLNTLEDLTTRAERRSRVRGRADRPVPQ